MKNGYNRKEWMERVEKGEERGAEVVKVRREERRW